MKRVLVLGGYGVFGSLISRELVANGTHITIAGRDLAKAKRLAESLGGNARAMALDARLRAACVSAFRDHQIVVHCAGPFSDEETNVLEACLQAGVHYVDIADDRAYVSVVRSFGGKFRDAGLAAVYGGSSLPGISEALASKLKSEDPAIPEKIRVTLFIGNKNPKGEAAVRSVFRLLGGKIRTRRGEIPGFGDPEPVKLPEPWGDRTVYNFESPEYDFFPEKFGADDVVVKLGFEWRLIALGFRLLAKAPTALKRSAMKPLLAMGNATSGFGSSGGAVVVDFFYSNGSSRRATLHAPQNGQKMAIFPCVSIVRRLLAEEVPAAAGAMTVCELIGAKAMFSDMETKDFHVSIE